MLTKNFLSAAITSEKSDLFPSISHLTSLRQAQCGRLHFTFLSLNFEYVNLKLIFIFLLLFSFSKIYAQTNSTGTPTVNLEYFDFKIMPDGKVKLVWETSNSKNIKRYNIYRSIDNKNFFLAGEIPANSTTVKDNFSHYDQTAQGGINYYKLEAVSPDGQIAELARRTVEMPDMTQRIEVFPKTQGGTIRLVAGEPILQMEVELMDMLGRTYRVVFVKENLQELTLITGPVEKGAYVLVGLMNGKRIIRVKAIFT
jgi:hypothetical protein